MRASRVTVLGAGSVRCTPAVVASLATFFGELPLDIRLADSDEERLDLFDRLARVCFIATNSSHSLSFTSDLYESLVDAEWVILQIGPNCARKFLRATRRSGFADLDDRSMIEQAVEPLVARIPSNAEVLSLIDSEIILPRNHYDRVDWPRPLSSTQRAAMPHQVLRWVRGEQGVFDLLKDNENSPLKAWLNDPTSAERVKSSP